MTVERPTMCEHADENGPASNPDGEQARAGDSGQTGAAANGGGGGISSLVGVGGAIIGGISLIGLVALAGGALTYERLADAGLPAEQAVAVVPRDDLLVVGAALLVPLVAVVAVTVVALWLVSAGLAKFINNKRGSEESPFEKTSVAVIAVGALSVGAAFGAFAYFYYYAPKPTVHDDLFVFAVSVVGAALCIGTWWVLEGVRGSFVWFAALTALVVVVVGLTITYFQTQERPSVRPAAVIFTNSTRGLSGIFIAETADDVYVSVVSSRYRKTLLARQYNKPLPKSGSAGGTPARMIEIPRSQIRALAIGDDESVLQALGDGPMMIKELDAEFPLKPPRAASKV
jgi:hypothetical protein